MKAGVWRVQFRRAERQVERGQPVASSSSPSPVEPTAATLLATEYYRLWDATAVLTPGPRDLEQAEAILREHGPETAKVLISCLVRVTKKCWPDCRSLSGAVQKYLPEALRLHQLEQRRKTARETADAARQNEQESLRTREQTERRLQDVWNGLPAAEREAVRREVLMKLGGATAPEAFIQRLCLEEIGRLPS